MSDDLLLSDREQEAWELTRTMPRDNAAEEMGVTRDTLETYLDRCYSKRKRARETIEWMDSI